MYLLYIHLYLIVNVNFTLSLMLQKNGYFWRIVYENAEV